MATKFLDLAGLGAIPDRNMQPRDAQTELGASANILAVPAHIMVALPDERSTTANGSHNSFTALSYSTHTTRDIRLESTPPQRNNLGNTCSRDGYRNYDLLRNAYGWPIAR